METLYIGKNEFDFPDFRLYNKSVEPFKRALRDHRHTLFEIVLFESGRGLYDTSTCLHTVEHGDIFVFSSNEYHCIPEIFNGEMLAYKLMQFSPDFFITECAGVDCGFDKSILSKHGGGFSNKLKGEGKEKIKRLIFTIEEELHHKQIGYEREVKNCVFEIMLTLIRSCGYIDRDEAVSCDSASLRLAVSYIESNLCEDISVMQIAKSVGINRNKLARLFEDSFSCTVWGYVLNKRIEKAKLLLETDKSKKVIDIAVLCGFNNTADFNKIFKKSTGLTPREYRSVQETALI